jgi:hypothetical protein
VNDLDALVEEFLAKLSAGKLVPEEQGTAFAVISDYIRRLEKVIAG